MGGWTENQWQKKIAEAKGWTELGYAYSSSGDVLCGISPDGKKEIVPNWHRSMDAACELWDEMLSGSINGSAIEECELRWTGYSRPWEFTLFADYHDTRGWREIRENMGTTRPLCICAAWYEWRRNNEPE